MKGVPILAVTFTEEHAATLFQHLVKLVFTAMMDPKSPPWLLDATLVQLVSKAAPTAAAKAASAAEAAAAAKAAPAAASGTVHGSSHSGTTQAEGAQSAGTSGGGAGSAMMDKLKAMLAEKTAKVV